MEFGKEEDDCYCCYRHGKDDIDYFLTICIFAKSVWRLHATIMGAETNNTNIRSTLLHWRNLPIYNEVQKLIHNTLPNFIFWNLWKNRCAVKYGGKQSSIQRVEYFIFSDIMKAIHITFPNIRY